MGKKNISSQDFLNLLDDQENSKDKAAFKPKKKNPVPPKFKLSPVQQELLDLALKHSPKFLQNLASSDQAKALVGKIEKSYFKAKRKVESLRKNF